MSRNELIRFRSTITWTDFNKNLISNEERRKFDINLYTEEGQGRPPGILWGQDRG